MSRERGPRGGRPLAEGANVGYPLQASSVDNSSHGASSETGHLRILSLLRIDGMKRLGSRLTWLHMLPHKSPPRSTPQEGEASHGPYWHRRTQEGKPDLHPR